jgi:hypothetical protein
MKRRHRLALTAVALASFTGGVWLLTSFTSRSEGPVSTALDRLGGAVVSLEHLVRRRFGGPGRADTLSWFAPYRRDLARLRRPDVVLLGAFDGAIPSTLDGVVRLERTLGTAFPLVQFYTAWGDKPDQRFPLVLASAVFDMGSIPVITWEPWLTDFHNASHPELPLPEARDSHGMAAVAEGAYDFYVDAWAIEAARFGKPFFLRFAHEMNDAYRYPWGPQNNTKEEYIAAWRHVVDRFRRAGAQNVIWVWSPHVAYEYWDLYYPGGDYVDWVATGGLNFGPIAQWSKWWTFAEIFGTKYRKLAAFGKPIMIAEFGSLAVGGDRNAWYSAALTDLPHRYPAVSSLLFFNVGADQTVTYQKVDWTIAGDSSLARLVATAIRPWSDGRKTAKTVGPGTSPSSTTR